MSSGFTFGALADRLDDLPVDAWHWMGYTRKPPKQDCFRDLLIKLDPAVLEEVLTAWIGESLRLDVPPQELAGVSLDGKTLCGTLRPFARAVHLLSLVDHQAGCVLSQCRVDEKTNEHKAALDLLKTIVLKGRVIVGDAMFCQRDLCQQIVDSGGDYFRGLLHQCEGEPAYVTAGNRAGTDRQRRGVFPPTLSVSVRSSERRPARSTKVTDASNAAR